MTQVQFPAAERRRPLRVCMALPHQCQGCIRMHHVCACMPHSERAVHTRWLSAAHTSISVVAPGQAWMFTAEHGTHFYSGGQPLHTLECAHVGGAWWRVLAFLVMAGHVRMLAPHLSVHQFDQSFVCASMRTPFFKALLLPW